LGDGILNTNQIRDRFFAWSEVAKIKAKYKNKAALLLIIKTEFQ